MCSPRRLEAPITELGRTALSVEMNTSRSTPMVLQALTTLRVPSELVRIASPGCASRIGTCLCAAAWNTTSGR